MADWGLAMDEMPKKAAQIMARKALEYVRVHAKQEMLRAEITRLDYKIKMLEEGHIPAPRYEGEQTAGHAAGYIAGLREARDVLKFDLDNEMNWRV